MNGKSEYAEKLKDPRWQKRRLAILERDEWSCLSCYDTESTLHVHHLWYSGNNPWDAPDTALITLCESCHEEESTKRKMCEERILLSLRKARILSCGIEWLAEGFEGSTDLDDVTLTAIAWALKNPNVLEEIRNQFLAQLVKDKNG
jgi:hypothetical protein